MRGKNRSYSIETEQGEFGVRDTIIETEQGEFGVRDTIKDNIPVELEHIESYSAVYEVLSPDGTIVFWLGKGHVIDPNEVVGWYYKSGTMHHGYGETFKETINMLLRDGWKYA